MTMSKFLEQQEPDAYARMMWKVHSVFPIRGLQQKACNAKNLDTRFLYGGFALQTLHNQPNIIIIN